MLAETREYTAFTSEELKEYGKQIKLNDKWVVYFHSKNTTKLYNDNTLKLIEIDNIATFWGTFNNIPKPTQMFYDGVNAKILKSTGETPGAISFFRKNVFPAWEDKYNIDGFEWSIKRFNDKNIDNMWINLLVSIIGGEFEHSEILNGVRIVDCSYEYKIIYRIEFWFSDMKYKNNFETIIKKILNVPNNTKLLFREHNVLKEKR